VVQGVTLKMPETKDRILQVDATIDLKDYFHAYFDAAKTRLIIACLIVGAVIAGFTYFFILIGEQKILLQLSPLFFGIPIVAIVGQFLRVHATYRKYIRNLSDSEKKIHYIFHENGDGFDIVCGNSFSHVAWEHVRKVIERPRYFNFVLSQYDTIIIPKRFLLRSSDHELMKEIIVSQVGGKAKLLPAVK
jgi:hypothetical protein